MYVGVILMSPFPLTAFFSIPHVRGGDPGSPHSSPVYAVVFPMYVGVILLPRVIQIVSDCIPHVRGGDPSQQLAPPC